MNRPPPRRICFYLCFIAFMILISKLFILITKFVYPLDTYDLGRGLYRIPMARSVLETWQVQNNMSEEPKVNTMCAETEDVHLLILINSAPQHFYLRWTIRKTWGAMRQYDGKQIRIAFVIGQADDWRTKDLISKESNSANDIVMGNFHDSYYNLTAKTLHGMWWVRNYCSNAKYIVKGDDDVLISPPTVIEYLSELPKEKSEYLYEGSCQIEHVPMRNKDAKWYISEVDYPNTTYPPYHLGVAVLHSYKALGALYDACYQVPNQLDIPINFPFDDVFIGICAQLTDIEVTCNNHIIVYDNTALRKFVRSRRPTCLMATSLAVHGLNGRQATRRRWDMINRSKIGGKFEKCVFNQSRSAI